MDDVGMDIARVRLQKDMLEARPLKEIVWKAIQNGTDPAYLAIRYNLPVDDLLRAKAEHERREQIRREQSER